MLPHTRVTQNKYLESIVAGCTEGVACGGEDILEDVPDIACDNKEIIVLDKAE